MRILRKREVIDRVRLSHQTIWRKEKIGEFPKRVQISPNVVGWFENEIDAWLASRKRGSSAEPLNFIAK